MVKRNSLLTSLLSYHHIVCFRSLLFPCILRLGSGSRTPQRAVALPVPAVRTPSLFSRRVCTSSAEGERSQGKEKDVWVDKAAWKPIGSLTRQRPPDPSNHRHGGCAAREWAGARPASPVSGRLGLQSPRTAWEEEWEGSAFRLPALVFPSSLETFSYFPCKMQTAH